jgi:hypothetical protein
MQVEALSHQKERLQLEVDTATTRAANNEKQQQELYDLCNTLQGEWLGPSVQALSSQVVPLLVGRRWRAQVDTLSVGCIVQLHACGSAVCVSKGTLMLPKQLEINAAPPA